MSADAPETRQDAILGVVAPHGLSDPTVPACDAVATIVALTEERDWFKAEMERCMRAASANHERAERLEAQLRETYALAEDRAAALEARTRERVVATERAAHLTGLLRDALDGLASLTADPRDPAIRTLLRRMRAAVGAG